MLSVDVRATFGDFALDARFDVDAQLTALFGRSGAGKTVLVNILAGLATPTEGLVKIGDRVLFDSNAGINLPPEKRQVGYVFQEGRLFPHFSVRSNLTYGMVAKSDVSQGYGLNDVVDLLDLGSLLSRRPRDLSGGEKQRVAIGRALLAAPKLLLMDEPLASLDVAHKNEILPFIERLRDEMGLPIVYVSHAMEEVVRLSDAMVLLSDGKVAAVGPVEDLTSRLDLRPLTGRYEAGAVVAVRVAGKDEVFGLTELAFAGNRLRVPRLDLPLGTEIRVRIRARDVALSLEPPTGISILNMFEGVVSEIDTGDGPQVDVLVDVGVSLIARVTRRSIHELGLTPGSRVCALIKAVAVDRHSLGRQSARPATS
jgi:molybdate transport system ATP-binding protein